MLFNTERNANTKPVVSCPKKKDENLRLKKKKKKKRKGW
jgi:hypothetical protein